MFTRLIQLKPHQILLLKGSAEIRAEGDGLTALAKPLKKGESTQVRRGKIIPFEAGCTTEVRVTLRGGADYIVDTGRVGVGIWRSVADRVFAPDVKCRKVVVVGATDAGKSTLSTYLLNIALSKGLTVGVIDEDVGQGDLAPPGCVGGKVLREQIFDLRDVEADFFGFVGAISPRSVGGIILNEVDRVGRRLEEVDGGFYIVNTDGYVAYEGVSFKVELIRRVNPDIVICFEDAGGGQVLYDRLRAKCGCDVVLAKRSAYSVKSVSERVRRRVSQYRHFLGGRQRLLIDLRKIEVSFLGWNYRYNVEVFGGLEVVKEDDVRNRLIIKAGSLDYVEMIREGGGGVRVVLGLDSLKGMFVGLGSAGEVSRFGRCVGVHPDFTIDVLTDSVSEVDIIFLSLIILRQYMRREYSLPVVRSL